MSEDVNSNPNIIKKVHFAQDVKERTVDIYVSAESLNICDNPWVEDTPGPAVVQQQAMPVISESSGRKHHISASTVFLVAVCLLLLAGIVVIEVQKTELRKTTKELTANITSLSKDRAALWAKFCSPKRNKRICKNLLRQNIPGTEDKED